VGIMCFFLCDLVVAQVLTVRLQLGKFAMESDKFLHDLHLAYIYKVSQDTSAFEYLVTEHLRMSGVYWGLTAVATLGATTEELRNDENLRVGDQPLGDWVMSCQDECGG